MSNERMRFEAWLRIWQEEAEQIQYLEHKLKQAEEIKQFIKEVFGNTPKDLPDETV